MSVCLNQSFHYIAISSTAVPKTAVLLMSKIPFNDSGESRSANRSVVIPRFPFQRMREGNVFTLFVRPHSGGGGGTPVPRLSPGLWSQVLPGGMYPNPRQEVPQSWLGSTPVPAEGTPVLARGYPSPGWRGEYPSPKLFPRSLVPGSSWG